MCQKFQIEVEVYPDPEFCEPDFREDGKRCKYIAHKFYSSMIRCGIYPDSGDLDKKLRIKKCSECKTAYQGVKV